MVSSLRPESRISEYQSRKWQQYFEEQTGIWLGARKSLLEAGVARRMRELDLDDIDLYWQKVQRDGPAAQEWLLLVDRIAIQSTRFFRDEDACECMRAWLQLRLDRREDLSKLMLWSAGCASGEEAYSLAMIATDVLNHAGNTHYFGVLGTDISKPALARARLGIYRERALDDITGVRRALFFQRRDKHHFQVRESLRKRMCFMSDNLLQGDSAPGLKIDAVFCLNVLLYFRQPRQLQVLDRLVRQLKPGGLLVIGQNEAIGWRDTRMTRINNRQVNAYLKL